MATQPCVGERAKLEVADIVRAHRAELEAKHWVTLEQRRVLSAMALCRTAALGGHLDVCRSCHLEWGAPHYLPQSTLSEVPGTGTGALDSGACRKDPLRELQRAGELPESRESLEHLMQKLERHDSWVVYVKKAFRHAEHVLKYLGRYTHRVAIANSRLVAIDQDHVTFRTKNGKVITLKSVEFLRRFTQHVLPKGLQKIRHYGLYAGAASDARAQASISLRGANFDETRINVARLQNWQAALKELTGRDVNICPKCGGQVVHQPLAAHARAPPEARRAA